MARTTYPIKEQETGIYSFVIKDEDGAPIPGSAVGDITLTLHCVESNTIVNSRDAQDVKNTNDVTIDEHGLVTWTVRVEDVSIVNDTLDTETHRALFLFTWTNGVVRSKPHEIDFVIENLRKLA